MSFIVYSKDGCPYCTKVINVLKLAELKHVVYKLGRDFSKTDFETCARDSNRRANAAHAL